MNRQPRIAVVSPFLDKQHGTERVVTEQIERLAHQHGWEVHIFSQRVEDLPGVLRPGATLSPPNTGSSQKGEDASHPPAGTLVWHRVPRVVGPHLLQYIWWFSANRLWRWWVCRFRGLRYDLVYSPGINCWDADAIAVHIVFREFYRRVGEELKLQKVPVRAWPRALHRRLYYRMIMALEKRIYPHPRVCLAAVSSLTAHEIERFFGREDVTVISNGVDAEEFSPRVRRERRSEARRRLGIEANDFVVLLIGNDWKKKGLDCLLSRH
jgi:glycosyltransferase involved in cell wall biosynthesis